MRSATDLQTRTVRAIFSAGRLAAFDASEVSGGSEISTSFEALAGSVAAAAEAVEAGAGAVVAGAAEGVSLFGGGVVVVVEGGGDDGRGGRVGCAG